MVSHSLHSDVEFQLIAGHRATLVLAFEEHSFLLGMVSMFLWTFRSALHTCLCRACVLTQLPEVMYSEVSPQT